MAQTKYTDGSGVTSNIQTQLNSKHDDTNHVALTNTEIDNLMA